MKDIANQIFESDLRLDKIVWLAGSVHGFSDDDFFEDVILEAAAPYMHKSMSVFADLPNWVEDQDAFQEWVCQNPKMRGFVVKATTPRPTKFHPDGRYTTMSFGYTTSTYFYVDRIEDAVSLAVEWQEKLIEKLIEKLRLDAIQ